MEGHYQELTEDVHVRGLMTYIHDHFRVIHDTQQVLLDENVETLCLANHKEEEELNRSTQAILKAWVTENTNPQPAIEGQPIKAPSWKALQPASWTSPRSLSWTSSR